MVCMIICGQKIKFLHPLGDKCFFIGRADPSRSDNYIALKEAYPFDFCICDNLHDAGISRFSII